MLGPWVIHGPLAQHDCILFFGFSTRGKCSTWERVSSGTLKERHWLLNLWHVLASSQIAPLVRQTLTRLDIKVPTV